MNENIELENIIMAYINYFKLIYVLELTKDKSLDSFIMLNGKQLLDKFVTDKNKYILKCDDNISLLERLFHLIEKTKKVNYSMSPLLKMELDNIGWINDITSIDPKGIYYETIINNCSNDVLMNLVLNSKDMLLPSSDDVKYKQIVKGIITK